MLQDVTFTDKDEENNNTISDKAGGEGPVATTATLKQPKEVKHSPIVIDQNDDEDEGDRENYNASPTWLPGPGTSYLSQYPWLDAPKSSKGTSTVGSVKSSRSRRSQKVNAKVKWCRILFLTSIICSSIFLVFYPLITHYIVEAAHANESFSYFPYAKANCTLKHKHPVHSSSVHAEHHSRLSMILHQQRTEKSAVS